MAKSGWATLEQIASDPASPHQFRALELIGAYAYGRPTQLIAGDPDGQTPALHVTVLFDRADDDDGLDHIALPG